MKPLFFLTVISIIISSSGESLLINPNFKEKSANGTPMNWQVKTPASVKYGADGCDISLTGLDEKGSSLVQNFKGLVRRTCNYSFQVKSPDQAKYRVYVEWTRKVNGKTRWFNEGTEWLTADADWQIEMRNYMIDEEYLSCCIVLQVEHGKVLLLKGLKMEPAPKIFEIGGVWQLKKPHEWTAGGVRVVGNRKGAVLAGIPVEPGKKYRLEYTAQGLTNAQSITAFHEVMTTITPCVEGRVAFNDVNDSPQRKFLVFKVPAGEKIDKIDISFYLRTSGIVQFKDFSLTEIAEDSRDAWLFAVNNPFYRDQIFNDENITAVSGTLQVTAPAESARITLSKAGRVLADLTLKLKSGGNPYSLPLPALTEGSYQLQCDIISGDKTEKSFTRQIRKLPKAPMEIKALPNRYLTINGKVFFPVIQWDIYHPYDDEALYYLARRGVNVTMVHISSEASLLKKLELARKYGIMLIAHINGIRERNHFDNYRNFLRKNLTDSVRNHPNLLGYFLIDEPLWAGVSFDLVKMSYDFIKDLDPYHPVWINVAPRNEIEDLRPYAEACDIFGVDIYPVPYPNTHSALEDKGLTACGKYALRMNEVTYWRKPLWNALQGFSWADWNTDRPPENPAYPNLIQSRFMAYDTMLNGGTGYGVWGLHYVRKPQFFDEIYQVTAEMHRMSGLFAQGRQLKDIPTGNPNVRCAVIEHQGNNYYFLLNLTAQNQTGKFDNTDVKLTPFEVVIRHNHALPPPAYELTAKVDKFEAMGNPFTVRVEKRLAREKMPSYKGTANWIWNKESTVPGGKCYLRKDFEINGNENAVMKIAADDFAKIYLNNQPLGKVTGFNLHVFDLKKYLQPGRNELVIHCIDAGMLPCGVLAELTIGSYTIVTDASWLSLPGVQYANLPSDADWKNAANAAIIAPYGGGAWKKNVKILQ